MKQVLFYIFAFLTISSFAQEKDKEKEQLLALKKANNFVYEGNEKAVNDDFVSAEMAYRKALSEQSSSVAGAYNLGTSYIQEGSYTEALFRLQQATQNATSKEEKHKAFHNIGNILMKEKKCKEAVEAFKSALRNNPSDNETRYNLALAKKCAEDQKDEQPDDNKDDQNKDQDQNQDKNKENQDQEEGDNKEDNKDKGDQDKKEGDDQKDDQGKPKEDNKDQGKGDDQKKEPQQQQPQPGQLSPQQVKNLLDAMNNQEQKVQEKMNAEKQKGEKIQTEKDW